jgi:hypothetical protein
MMIVLASAAILGTRRAAGSDPWFAYVASILVVLVVVCGPVYLWWALGRWDKGGGDSGDDGGDGDGGSRVRGRRTPPKGPPDTDPAWWPEFERQFAAYSQVELARSPVRDDARRSIGS